MSRTLSVCLLAVGVISATDSPNAGWQNDLTPITKADWNYDRAAHLLERAGFGGTPEEIQRLAAMTPRDAVRELVYYQKAANIELPAFDESGIFPSKDFVPNESGALEQAFKTGEAQGVKVEKKPGTMWMQPVVDQLYYLRFSNNVVPVAHTAAGEDPFRCLPLRHVCTGLSARARVRKSGKPPGEPVAAAHRHRFRAPEI